MQGAKVGLVCSSELVGPTGQMALILAVRCGVKGHAEFEGNRDAVRRATFGRL